MLAQLIPPMLSAGECVSLQAAPPRSRSVPPRLAAPSSPVRPVPPRPEDAATSTPSERLCSVAAQEFPRRMRGDIPAALPGSASRGDVLADEFSLANVLQAANVKLAAAKSE